MLAELWIVSLASSRNKITPQKGCFLQASSTLLMHSGIFFYYTVHALRAVMLLNT